MKFTTLAPLAAVLAFATAGVSAQTDECQNCLQTSLKALPLCVNVNITLGDFDPSSSPAYAACLCQSTAGAWIDSCIASKTCSDDVLSLKAAYASSLQDMGLNCNGTTPTFSAVPSATVAPSSVLPSGTPTSSGGPAGGSPTKGADKSAGQKSTAPSFMLAETMGVLAIVAAIGASFL